MRTRELHRAVARATGESLATIKRLGFLLAEPHEPLPDVDDEDLGPRVIDWDELARSYIGPEGGADAQPAFA